MLEQRTIFQIPAEETTALQRNAGLLDSHLQKYIAFGNSDAIAAF
jgi:hypothetical protein